MRMRGVIAVAGLLLAAPFVSAGAQATGDRARLVFTVSGAFVDGKGLWSVPSQRLMLEGLEDNLVISRNIKSTLGASLAGTYFPGQRVGLTAEAFLLGLGYDDSCRLTTAGGSAAIASACASVNEQDKSAAAVAVTVGGIFRVASREFISPFVRASVGLLLMNQSSVLTQGENASRALLTIYEDDKRTRIRPAIGLGAGASMMLSRGYHLRWEVRDNIVGIERVSGPVAAVGEIPPHETDYKHLFSVFIGLDVVLERARGRRY
jgi:opacity protein-like surface antigen